MSDQPTVGYFTRSRKRSLEKEKDENTEEQVPEPEQTVLECAICLQICVHPAKLPCGHIFCFTCLKGAAHNGRKCAMCRAPISPHYIHNPVLVDQPSNSETDQESYKWFYEGRHGWWEYDDRSNATIEQTYVSKKERKLELLLAGYVFIIDLDEMKQYRKSDTSRERRIKRDFKTAESIGIAGIRKPGQRPFRSATRRLPLTTMSFEERGEIFYNQYGDVERIIDPFQSLDGLLSNTLSSTESLSQEGSVISDIEDASDISSSNHLFTDDEDSVDISAGSSSNCSIEIAGSIRFSLPVGGSSYIINLTSDMGSDDSLHLSDDDDGIISLPSSSSDGDTSTTSDRENSSIEPPSDILIDFNQSDPDSSETQSESNSDSDH